jgi:ABC-type amino acid transport/signal transduction systems, periplasmic component/domain
MKFNLKKLGTILVAITMVASLAIMTGCGGAEKKTDNKKIEKKTYVVATRGTFRPFTYVDDKGVLTGYDIEILKEVEKRNPDIKFEFKTMSVDAGFLGLESGQVDIIANQITFNKKRAEKSIWTKEVNNYTSRKIAVRGNENNINSIDDLRGKKVAVTASSEVARQLEEYNQTANPKIEFVFTDKGFTECANLVITGRADATPQYEVTIDDAKKILGLDIKAVGPVIASDPTFFALKKSEKGQALADKIDATVKEMRADGTLKKLSEKILGKDYSVPQLKA